MLRLFASKTAIASLLVSIINIASGTAFSEETEDNMLLSDAQTARIAVEKNLNNLKKEVETSLKEKYGQNNIFYLSAHKNHFNNALMDYNVHVNDFKTEISYFLHPNFFVRKSSNFHFLILMAVFSVE